MTAREAIKSLSALDPDMSIKLPDGSDVVEIVSSGNDIYVSDIETEPIEEASYTVTIHERRSRDIEVIAGSPEEAIDKVKNRYESREIELSDIDYAETKYEL